MFFHITFFSYGEIFSFIKKIPLLVKIFYNDPGLLAAKRKLAQVGQCILKQ